MKQDLRSSQSEEFSKALEYLRTFPEIKLPKIIAEMEAHWKSLAGEKLEIMLASRNETINQLTAPSANVRNAAYQILLKKWPTDSDVLPECMRAIEFDSDIEVRVRALYYLAALYREKSDLPASRFLSEIVSSPLTPTRIREAGYLSLLRIQGRPLPSALIKSVQSGDHSAFGDIDWELVRRFSSGQKTGKAPDIDRDNQAEAE